jgi:4-hydroxybenzoate polyprenyltransferase
MKLNDFKKMVRWHCWAHGKVPLFCTGLFFVVLKRSLYSVQTVYEVLTFLIFIILASIYGYLINDLCDMDIDIKQGKHNVFEKIGKARGIIIVSVILILSVLCGLSFKNKYLFPHFLFGLFFFATFYSAPPIRLKTRGFIGLLIVFLTQYPLPLIMIFSAFDSFGTFDMWAFAFFSTITGASQEIGHQRYDMRKDKETGTHTYAVERGEKKINALYRLFIKLDAISLWALVLLITVSFWQKTVLNIPHLVVIPFVIYSILMFLFVQKILKSKNEIIDPYFQYGRNDTINIMFTLFPNFFLPLFLAVLLVLEYFPFIVFVIVFMSITYITFPNANPVAKLLIIKNEIRTMFNKG